MNSLEVVFDAPPSSREAAEESLAGALWTWPLNKPWGRTLLFVVTSAGYATGLLLALALIRASELSSVFFIPAGITVALAIRLPSSTWWVVVAAVGVTEATIDHWAGYRPHETFGFTVANMAEPVIAATLIRRRCGPLDLARVRHVGCFVAAGVVLATGLAAAIGSLLPWVIDGEEFHPRFFQWWIGDALGVLLVGSAILAWRSSRDRRSLWSPAGATQVVGTIVITLLIMRFDRLPLLFLVLIGAVVAGAVFGVRAVAVTAVLVASIIAIHIAAGGNAPFVGLDETSALLLTKLQLTLFTLAGLLVAAEAHEGAIARVAASESAMVASITARDRALVRQTAIRLQQALLPALGAPSEAVQIAGRYEPGSTSLLVGGDWYGVHAISHDKVSVSVGDVVGHGLDASTAMGRLSTAVAVLAQRAPSPARLLADLDAYASRAGVTDFATAAYAVFDPASGALTYGSAGHPPMLVASPDGHVRWLSDAQSPPLIGLPGNVRRESSTALHPGDLLVAYSDGLIERRGEPIDVGLRRLAGAVANRIRLDPDRLCDALLSDLNVHLHREDDVVVLVLRYVGATAV